MGAQRERLPTFCAAPVAGLPPPWAGWDPPPSWAGCAPRAALPVWACSAGPAEARRQRGAWKRGTPHQRQAMKERGGAGAKGRKATHTPRELPPPAPGAPPSSVESTLSPPALLAPARQPRLTCTAWPPLPATTHPDDAPAAIAMRDPRTGLRDRVGLPNAPSTPNAPPPLAVAAAAVGPCTLLGRVPAESCCRHSTQASLCRGSRVRSTTAPARARGEEEEEQEE